VSAIAPIALALLVGPYMRTMVDKNNPNSHCLLWTHPQITFVQDTLGTQDTGNGSEFLAFSKSLASWNEAAAGCSSVHYDEGPRIVERKIGWERGASDNHNVVLYRRVGCTAAAPAGDPCLSDKSCYNKYDCWDGNLGTLALTTTTYDLDTGHIYDTDIEANDVLFFFTTADAACASCDPKVANSCAVGTCTGGMCVHAGCVVTDVQNTMTHELGHALGLDHSPDSYSTMFATADKGETSKRQIDSFSKQYLCDAYPSVGIPRDCVALRAPTSRLGAEYAGTPLGCAAAPGSAAMPLLAMAVLRAFGRRRGRPLR
jgi:uncharacterized protein (TIGR03382 family)